MPSLEEVETEGETYDPRRMAALLGVHLVSQVLDEACSVVNNEQRRGWFKDLRSRRLAVSGHANLFQILQGDNENKENVSHLTTSTPHKDETIKSKPENSFIGQGDEEIDMVSKEDDAQNGEEIKQDVEDIITDNEAQLFSSHIMVSLMNKLFKSLESAFAPSEQQVDGEEQELSDGANFLMHNLQPFRASLDVTSEANIVEIDEDGQPKNQDEYCYSFLENAYETNAGNDVAFYIDEDSTSVNDFDKIKVVVQAEIHAEIENLDASVEEVEVSDEEEERAEQKLESARYENAYLSLNRDYEQCSDDEGDPVLQDPKSPMQEVELFAASTEDEDDDNSSYREAEEQQRKELAATSAISGASGSRKSRTSLVSRCRTQGARLLSCLRGWWRRKTPGKRKECRAPSVRGVCPLSPHIRRRASSLLDQRRAYSPLPCKSVVWKFNTVNQALVNSNKWKEYTFDANADGCGEHC